MKQQDIKRRTVRIYIWNACIMCTIYALIPELVKVTEKKKIFSYWQAGYIWYSKNESYPPELRNINFRSFWLV